MPSSLLQYRLRIRNASTVLNPDGTADALIISSVPGGDNPYITEPPNGDGLEFDPIRGTVRSGSYTVLVADALISGTSRVVTSQLVDAQNRQQLISRRAYLEYRVDGGGWLPLIAGYILGIRLTNALAYQFTVGDSRRIEQTRTVFTRDDTYFGTRGTLLGGPLVNITETSIGAGPFVNRGGWKFRVAAVNGNVADLAFVEGYNGPTGRTSSKWLDVTKSVPAKAGYLNYLDGIAASYIDPTQREYSGLSGVFCRFPGLVLKTYASPGGSLYANATPISVLPGLFTLTGGYGAYANTHLRAEFAAGAPMVGAYIYASLITLAPSTYSPMYVTGHPVDIVRNLYLSQGIPIDSASFDALKLLQGNFFRYTMRVTEPRILAEVVEELAGPFGIGLRVSTTGAVQAFSSRIKWLNTPSVQVDTANLRGAGDGVFDLEESTVVTTVTMEGLTFNGLDSLNTDSSYDIPLDGIVTAKETVSYDNADVAAFSTKELKYSLNGMIHSTNWYGSQLSSFILGVAGEIFDRYGRGAVGGTLQCLRGNAGIDGVQPGDEIYVNVAQFPNNGKRIGDDPAVGARIMQVVRRTETPSGPELRLLDSGTAFQPALGPTLSVAKSTTTPYSTAQFTITNAAALNAAGYQVLRVAVQYAYSATMPTTDGTIFTRYEGGSIPTGAVALPPAPPGYGVWARARTEQSLMRPSAWSAWQGVTLDALASPTSLSALGVWQNAVELGWTNSSSALPIEVFIAPSSASPTISPSYRVGLLPPGSTRFTYRLLSGPGVSYNAAVRYALPDGNGSTAATVAFTTTSASETMYRPAGIAAMQADPANSVADSSTRQGIPIALWASNQAYDFEIQRAPNVVVDGVNTPGTGATIATVTGSTTVFADYTLPDTTALYWYRARHVLGGFTTTGYTCWKSSRVMAVPQDLQRPSAVAPIIVPSFTEAEATPEATVTLTITDPQCRVDIVQFRKRTNGGAWSAWVVDIVEPYTYTQTIPETGFLDIEYQVLGFNGAGDYGVLAGETVAFDRNKTSDMVSVVGTFDSTGQFVLVIAADSDTASIRYATSTSSQPALATVQAQTAINGRRVSTTLPGPYASNATVYVSVLGYTAINGGGTESVLFEYQFIRDGGLLYTQCMARMSTSTATDITVIVTGTAPTGSPTVQLVAVTGSATLSSGAAIGTAVPSGSSWTFTRGAALGQPGGAQFRAVLAGAQSDDDFIEIPEQGRDTTYLATRARVLSTSSTSVVVRVAVLDKYTALLCSVSYLATGVGTITPSGTQTVTAAVGDTFPAEVAGQYIDFTIDRPAFGTGTGRVTFTATNASRVADSDGVDIPAVERDTVALASRVRVTATTATTITVRMAVADPYPQGANSATITYSVTGLATPTQTGGGALPGTITVTPASTITEAAGTYYDFLVTRPAAGSPPGRISLTATAATRTETTGAATIPAQDLIGPSLQVNATPGPTSYSIAYTYDGTVTLSIDGGSYSAPPASPITVARNASGGYLKTYAFQCTKDSQTISNAVVIPPQDMTGPTLRVSATPGSSSYSVAYIYDGTITLSIDGGSFTTPPASPITVARNAPGGADKVYSFACTKDGQGINSVVVIPAQPSSGGTSGPYFSVFYPYNSYYPNDGGGSFDIHFTGVNMPSGVTYNLFWTITVGAYGYPSGNYTGVYDTQQISFALASAPQGQFVINAMLAGQVIATDTYVGSF